MAEALRWDDAFGRHETMKLELREDERAREQRSEYAKQAVKPIFRVVCFIGLPIAIVWSAVLFLIEPDRTLQFLVPVPMIGVIGFGLYGIAFFDGRMVNRWVIGERWIQVRGDRFLLLSRRKVGEWFTEKIEGMPGHYVLSVRVWGYGASILLNESDYPLSEIEKLFPPNKRTEVSTSSPS
jgi:hypothetical protein